MKKWLLLMAGLTVLGLSGCKDDDKETELSASLTMKTWEVGDPEIIYGPPKTVFAEREPIAFDMKLTNKGFKTERVEYGCGFSVIEIYDQNGEKVYDSKQAPIGCSADWNIEIVYMGESIETIRLWDQELFLIDAEGGEIGGTGEYLQPGNYTVMGYAAVKLGSSEADWTIIPLAIEHSLTIEASE